jgi:hypothetical protein
MTATDDKIVSFRIAWQESHSQQTAYSLVNSIHKKQLKEKGASWFEGDSRFSHIFRANFVLNSAALLENFRVITLPAEDSLNYDHQMR